MQNFVSLNLGDYLTISSLIGIALLICVTAVFKRRYLSSISDIPGPPLASVSRLWQIITLIKGDSINEFYNLHRKHGAFVRVAPNEVSVSHPEAPRKLLLAPLPKDNWYRAGALPDYRFQTTLSTTDPKAKVARAKHFMQGYSTSSLLTLESRMDEIFVLLLNWMDKFSLSQKPLELAQFFSFTAADITGQLLFSRPFGFLASGRDVDDTLSRSHKIVGLGTVAGYFPWLNKLVSNPFVTWTGILPFRLIFVTALNAIAERENTNQSQDVKQQDILTQWFASLDQGKITLRDVQAQTTLGVLAGTDAMSTGLQSFVYHMIRHETAWKRSREEIRAAQREGRCLDAVVSYADAQELRYLQACIKESLRLFGPLGTGLPRVVPQGGIKIGERTFEEGTTLSIHPYTMMRDENFWGSDANEFNPDRWMKEGSSELDRYYMPFGLGYAACPGINLAKIEMSKLAASIVRDYDIRQVNPKQEWSYEAYFNTLPHDWPVLVTKVQ